MSDVGRGAEVLRVLRAVRSVRDLRPDPLPHDALVAILEAARWTGSGMNRQPWTFVVVRDRGALAGIAEASPNAGHVAHAGAAIVLVMDGDMPEITTFDEGRAAERILIAATAQGIASAIGWIPPAGRPAVRALLGIPEEKRVRTLVALGTATASGARTKAAPGTARRALDEVVRWERYA
ncbi:MAG: nitroreductase family protein [Chloroflexi bacterium]|jgi:nitroreductase|nr:nitroreductase family protein [Chloroflexota bacterium]